MSARRPTVVPPRVRPGDTVAVVSPSFPALARWPHRREQGIRYLESLGLRVRLMPNALGSERWLSGSAEARAADLNDAFADPAVAVVLSAIGGDHALQLLPHLDFALIAARPKVFCGYSDSTVLHCALAARASLRTFYGPALVTTLAEHPAVLDETDAALRAAWFGAGPPCYRPAPTFTDELLDFDQRRDLERPRHREPSAGWRTIRGGSADGALVGGCLETLYQHVKGTPDWPDLDGAVLLLETSEETNDPAPLDAMLAGLEQLGVFAAVAGVIVGRPIWLQPADVAVYWDVVAAHLRNVDGPVLGDVECGHADPLYTWPLGARVRVDADERVVRALEPVTR